MIPKRALLHLRPVLLLPLLLGEGRGSLYVLLVRKCALNAVGDAECPDLTLSRIVQ